MEASQSIQLKTEQKLVISQRLQQQLAILHMTLQEVAALANEQLQSNPMLEVAEGAEAADSPFSDLSLDALEGTLARSESFDDGALPASSGATFYRAWQSGEAPADFLRYTYKPESLEDYLAFQLADWCDPSGAAAGLFRCGGCGAVHFNGGRFPGRCDGNRRH